ncbi:hypothetical protein [Ruegeria jejuensis]|uniref:hypothetical protein n=1 Tax=Ruegeria jejuensis TaxID=3233338 RepID=UPI00355C6CE2
MIKLRAETTEQGVICDSYEIKDATCRGIPLAIRAIGAAFRHFSPKRPFAQHFAAVRIWLRQRPAAQLHSLIVLPFQPVCRCFYLGAVHPDTNKNFGG